MVREIEREYSLYSETTPDLRKQVAASFGLTLEQLGISQTNYAATATAIAARIEKRMNICREILGLLSDGLVSHHWYRHLTPSPRFVEFMRRGLASERKLRHKRKVLNKARRTQRCRTRR